MKARFDLIVSVVAVYFIGIRRCVSGWANCSLSGKYYLEVVACFAIEIAKLELQN